MVRSISYIVILKTLQVENGQSLTNKMRTRKNKMRFRKKLLEINDLGRG